MNQARRDFDRLVNNRRHNKVFRGLVGYAASREFGIHNGGYHYHCFFFFHFKKEEGKEERQDEIRIADEIGEYWNTRITEGRGRFFNCNKKKRDYWRLGIGKINHYDDSLRNVLNETVALYVTKKDVYFELLQDGSEHGLGPAIRYRNFRRSNLPAAPPAIRKGRPRKAASSLPLVVSASHWPKAIMPAKKKAARRVPKKLMPPRKVCQF